MTLRTTRTCLSSRKRAKLAADIGCTRATTVVLSGDPGPVTPEPFSKKLDGIPPQEAASMVMELLNKLWSEAELD